MIDIAQESRLQDINCCIVTVVERHTQQVSSSLYYNSNAITEERVLDVIKYLSDIELKTDAVYRDLATCFYWFGCRYEDNVSSDKSEFVQPHQGLDEYLAEIADKETLYIDEDDYVYLESASSKTYKKLIEMLKKAIEIFSQIQKKIDFDWIYLAFCYHILGNIHLNCYSEIPHENLYVDQEQAVKDYKAAINSMYHIQKQENEQYKLNLASIYFDIGEVYWDLLSVEAKSAKKDGHVLGTGYPMSIFILNEVPNKTDRVLRTLASYRSTYAKFNTISTCFKNIDKYVYYNGKINLESAICSMKAIRTKTPSDWKKLANYLVSLADIYWILESYKEACEIAYEALSLLGVNLQQASSICTNALMVLVKAYFELAEFQLVEWYCIQVITDNQTSLRDAAFCCKILKKIYSSTDENLFNLLNSTKKYFDEIHSSDYKKQIECINQLLNLYDKNIFSGKKLKSERPNYCWHF